MHTFEATRGESTTVVDARVPHHPDNLYHPFMFMHHPATAWECAVLLDREGKRVEVNGSPVYEILPSLRKFKIKPGTHGIRQGKNDGDGAAWLPTKTRRESEGWQFIAQNAIVPIDGAPGIRAFGVDVPGGYVVRYDGQRGTIYSDAWRMPTMRPGTKKVTWQEDPGGFAQFRRDLIKRGVIQPPDREAVEALIRVQEKRAGRRITDVHIPAVAVRVEAENKKLIALQVIAEHVDAGEAPNSAPTPQVAAPDAPEPPKATRGPGRPRKAPPVGPLAVARAAQGAAPIEDGEDDTE